MMVDGGGGEGWGLRVGLPGEVVDAPFCGSHLCCCGLEGFDLCLVREWSEGWWSRCD